MESQPIAVPGAHIDGLYAAACNAGLLLQLWQLQESLAQPHLQDCWMLPCPTQRHCCTCSAPQIIPHNLDKQASYRLEAARSSLADCAVESYSQIVYHNVGTQTASRRWTARSNLAVCPLYRSSFQTLSSMTDMQTWCTLPGAVQGSVRIMDCFVCQNLLK